MEEDLQRSRKARRRVVAIAHTVFGGMILIVTVVFVAFLQRNNWQILGVSPSFPKVAVLSLVFLLGGLGLVIWLEWKSLSEEPPMENPDNRLQEIIRKEKWAMYEEDLERRRRGEEPKD